MEFVEYPKSLYKSVDDMCVVLDADEEKAAKEEGYGSFEDARAKLDAPVEPEVSKKGKK